MKPRRGKLTLGIDLGGTKVLALVTDRRGRLLGRARARTGGDEGVERVVARIAQTARLAMRRARVPRRRIGAAGIAAPGVIDPKSGIVRTAPNLRDFHDVPLPEMLGKELDIPFVLENDANAGAFAEHRLGAGRGGGDLIGIFVGTGIGGGIVLDGRIHEGMRQAAGEIGHMAIVADDRLCGCGRRGCIEATASRSGVVRAIHAAVAAGRETQLSPFFMAGSDTRQILRSSAIADAYRARDALTMEVLARAQKALGVLAGNLVNLLDPGVVVFGGGLIEALGPRFVVGIRRSARERFLLPDRERRVRITLARLGDDAVALGAGLIARERIGSGSRK
jgi:glucokinase